MSKCDFAAIDPELKKQLDGAETKAEKLAILSKSIQALESAQATLLGKLESKERARVEALLKEAPEVAAKTPVSETFDATEEGLDESEYSAPANRDFEVLSALRERVAETFENLREEGTATVAGVSEKNLSDLSRTLNRIAELKSLQALDPTPTTQRELDDKYDSTNFALNRAFSLLAREEALRGAGQLLTELEPKDNSFREVLDALITFGATDTATRTRQNALIKRLVDGFTDGGGEQALADTAVDVMTFFRESEGTHSRESVVLLNRHVPDISEDADMPRQDGDAVGIDAYLSVGRKAARGILGLLPAVHALLATVPGLRALLPDGMALTLTRHRGKAEFMAFRNQLDDILHDEILSAITDPRAEDQRQFVRGGRNRIREDFDAGPIHYLRNAETGRLNSNVVTAIAAEALAWLGTTGATTLTVNTVDQVKQILGVERLENPRAAMQALKHVGSLRDTVATAIGQPVVRKHLGLVRNENSTIDAFFESRLENSIGLAAVVALYKAGLIDFQPMPNKDFQALKGLKTEDPSIVTFIKLKTVADPETGALRRTPAVLALGDTYKRARYLLDKVFNVENKMKGPLTEEQDREAAYVERKIRGSSTRVDDRTTENLKRIQGYKLKLQPRTKVLFEAFPDTDTFKRQVMGYVDLNQATKRGKDGAEGLNLSIDREVDTYIEMKGFCEESYRFKYRTIRNMRATVDSNQLNYQASKGLHRVAIYDESWSTKIGADDLKLFREAAEQNQFNDVPENIQEFLAATAFALDIKVAFRIEGGPKYAAQGIDKSVEDEHLWRGIWENMRREEGLFSQAVESLKAREQRGGDFTDEETVTVGKAVQEGGQKAWSLIALDAWGSFEAALEQSKTGLAEFENRMPMEVNGLTNGLAILLLQIPGPDSSLHWKMLGRVGIFKKGCAVKSFGSLFRENPSTLDHYQELGFRVDKVIKEIISNEESLIVQEIINNNAIKLGGGREIVPLNGKLVQLFLRTINAFSDEKTNPEAVFTDVLVDDEEDVTKYARSIGKHLIMTSAVYGAGERAVANQIAVENPYDTPALEKFYAKLKKIAYDEDLDSKQKTTIIHGMIKLIAEAVIVDKNGPFSELSKEGKEVFKKRYVAEQDIPTVDQIQAKGIVPFVKEFLLKPTVETALQNRIKATHGYAANKIIREMFGHQQYVRDNMNTALAFIAKVNEEMFKKRYIEKMATKGNRPPTRREMEEIKRELIAEGLGTVIPHPNSDSTDLFTHLDFSGDSEILARDWLIEQGVFKKGDRKLEALTKTRVAVRSGIQITKPQHDEYGMEVGEKVEEQQSVTAETRINLPDADKIRRKGFARLIQSTDAAVMAEVYGKYRILHALDDFIIGINNVREVTRYANEMFFEINKKYNLFDLIHQKFESVSEKLNIAEKDGVFTEKEANRMREYVKKGEIGFDQFQEILKDLNAENTRLRNQVFEEIGAVNQFSKDNSPYEVQDKTSSVLGFSAQPF